MAVRQTRLQGFRIRQEADQLCSGHGCMCNSCIKWQHTLTRRFQVFGNSNSLPISLVLSLSKTLKGLHWDQVPGDNDNEVAARGILYLLIFQQLGQLVRWTWGYNVLLAPPPDPNKAPSIEGVSRDTLIEEGRYRDDPDEDEELDPAKKISTSSDYGSGSHTPGSMASSVTADEDNDRPLNGEVLPTPTNGNVVGNGPGNLAGNPASRQRSNGHITTFPTYDETAANITAQQKSGISGFYYRLAHSINTKTTRARTATHDFFARQFHRLPPTMQKYLSLVYAKVYRFLAGVWEFMNPPLWAMLIALIVASVPALQSLFFEDGSFVKNSVTRAVAQSGGVAVPLILVVLGANLARNTLPADQLAEQTEEGKKEERNLLIASLVSRMLLPTLIMAPILAIVAKFVPVSILDDPIFVIVCFLLTGAPSALQLAQICQINNVYMGAMSRLLFQSYVVWYVFNHTSSFWTPLLTSTTGFYLPPSSWSCWLWKSSNGPQPLLKDALHPDSSPNVAVRSENRNKKAGVCFHSPLYNYLSCIISDIGFSCIFFLHGVGGVSTSTLFHSAKGLLRLLWTKWKIMQKMQTYHFFLYLLQTTFCLVPLSARCAVSYETALAG